MQRSPSPVWAVLVLTLSLFTMTAIGCSDKPNTEVEMDQKTDENGVEKVVIFVDLDATKAAEHLEKHPETKILDVRTPGEFAKGHLKGAMLLDFRSEDFEAKLAELDRKATWMVHCQSGGRSGRALEIMKKLDFESVYHIQDGYGGWMKAELPVEN